MNITNKVQRFINQNPKTYQRRDESENSDDNDIKGWRQNLSQEQLHHVKEFSKRFNANEQFVYNILKKHEFNYTNAAEEIPAILQQQKEAQFDDDDQWTDVNRRQANKIEQQSRKYQQYPNRNQNQKQVYHQQRNQQQQEQREINEEENNKERRSDYRNRYENPEHNDLDDFKARRGGGENRNLRSGMKTYHNQNQPSRNRDFNYNGNRLGSNQQRDKKERENRDGGDYQDKRRYQQYQNRGQPREFKQHPQYVLKKSESEIREEKKDLQNEIPVESNEIPVESIDKKEYVHEEPVPVVEKEQSQRSQETNQPEEFEEVQPVEQNHKVQTPPKQQKSDEQQPQDETPTQNSDIISPPQQPQQFHPPVQVQNQVQVPQDYQQPQQQPQLQQVPQVQFYPPPPFPGYPPQMHAPVHQGGFPSSVQATGFQMPILVQYIVFPDNRQTTPYITPLTIPNLNQMHLQLTQLCQQINQTFLLAQQNQHQHYPQPPQHK